MRGIWDDEEDAEDIRLTGAETEAPVTPPTKTCSERTAEFLTSFKAPLLAIILVFGVGFTIVYLVVDNTRSSLSSTYQRLDATLVVPYVVVQTGANGQQIILPRGQPGEQGPTGITGAVGPLGERGVVGAQGATGPVGITGAQGPTGSTGEPGQDDPRGATGITGETGDAGYGIQGPKGPPGTKGPVGPTGGYGIGPTGPLGETGYQGIQGPVGDTGLQGPPGPEGPPGTIPGPDGVTGPAGSTGEKGPNNPGGERGPIGAVGAKGETGFGYYKSFASAFFGDASNGTVVFAANTTLQSHVMATTIFIYSNTTVELNGFSLMATQWITLNGVVRGTYHERDNVTADVPLQNVTVGQCSPFESTCSLPYFTARPSRNSTCFVGGRGGNLTRATCVDWKRPTDPMSLLGGLRDGRTWGGGTEGGAGNGTVGMGRGGGVAILFSPILNGTGRVDCSGESGRDAVGPIVENAGGGGGGGLAVLMTSQLDVNITVNITGGRGGVGWSYGADGESGTDGQLIHWVVF